MNRIVSACFLFFLFFVNTFAGRPKPRKKVIIHRKTLHEVVISYNRSTIFPLKLSKNSRYLVTQHNEPFLLNADAGWLLFHKLRFEQARQYIDNRHSKFFNAVFLQVLPPEPNLKNAYQSAPFNTNGDFSDPKEAYFKYIEDLVRYANNQQMIVGLAPTWLDFDGSNWAEVQKQNGTEKCRNYGQYLGKRFGKYNNVLWIMSGNQELPGNEAVQGAIAEGIKSAAPNHLMTYQATSPQSSADILTNATWLDLNMVNLYHKKTEAVRTSELPQTYELLVKEYQKQPNKAFVVGELQHKYENIDNEQTVRRQVYWAMLSGGAGNCYGSSVCAFEKNWQQKLNLKSTLSMSRFYKIFNGLPWELLQPETSGELVVSGQGNIGDDDYSPMAVLPNYRLALMYMPVGHPVKIDMAKMKGSNLRVLWINPKTNQRWAGGYFKPRAVRVLIPPTLSDDWILLIGNVGKK